jgi:hypothetical protein
MIDDGTGSIEVSKWADNKEGMEADDEASQREAMVYIFFLLLLFLANKLLLFNVTQTANVCTK